MEPSAEPGQAKVKVEIQPLDELKNNLPLISISLLIVGVINLIVYYDHFNVDILSYLDFTEVFQLQFVFYAIAFGIILVMVFTWLFFYAIGPSDDDIIRMRKEYFERTTPEQRHALDNTITAQNKRLKWILRGCIINICIIIISYVIKLLFFFSDVDRVILLLISVFIIGVFLFGLYSITDSLMAGNENAIVRPRLRVLLIFMILVFMSYVSGVSAYVNALSHESLGSSALEMRIITEKDTVETNITYRFIGKTKNYTFFYNMDSKQATVFKNDDIIKAELKAGINYSVDKH